MRPLLTNLSKRARAAAEGSPDPAGQEQQHAEAPAVARAGERGSMRRRARRLMRTREALVSELGALVVEMRRLDRENPELLARKAAAVSAIDDELRGLRAGIEQGQTVRQVVAAGVSGSCARCSTLLATDDRFCSHCGLAVAEIPAPRTPAPPIPAQARPEAEPASAARASAPPPPPPPSPPVPELITAARPER